MTSVENIEVWMTLLNKIELLPVQAFTKLPAYLGDDPTLEDESSPQSMLGAEHGIFSLPPSRHGEAGTRHDIVSTPAAPSQNRPSSKPGGRSGKNLAAAAHQGHGSNQVDHFPDHQHGEKPGSGRNSGSPSRERSAGI